MVDRIMEKRLGQATLAPADSPGTSPNAPAGRQIFFELKPQLCERQSLLYNGAGLIPAPQLLVLQQ
jgi:hypothetical protein